MNDEEDSDAFGAFFKEQRLAVPECFISTDGAKGDDEARLLVTDPSTMEHADHFLLTVPEAFPVGRSACRREVGPVRGGGRKRGGG